MHHAHPAILIAAVLFAGLACAANGGASERNGVVEEAGVLAPDSGELLESPYPRPFGTTIDLYSSTISGAGAAPTPHRLAFVSDLTSGAVRRLIALPSGASARLLSLEVSGGRRSAKIEPSKLQDFVRFEDAGMLRDQRLGWLIVDATSLAQAASPIEIDTVRLDLEFVGASDRRASLPTGPMSTVCARTVLNYEVQPEDAAAWRPSPAGELYARAGTVSYCESVSDCATSAVDIIFLITEELASAPAIYAYASHHASYFGMNVGIVSTAALTELSAEALHQFIQDVYETQSAEHFADGHLGFVLLVGDAYADDNETVMMPAYYGYGGNQSASDHYYACVSGEDDFEDVMVGRLSVGNLDELVTALSKSAFYMPHTQGETWHERVLLIGGLFYTIKDDYVALFDQYDELVPDEIATDRIYRHDYGTNESCALDVVDAFNDGYLFVNFNGDGWISTWDATMSTAHIPLMTNQQRLPIVLSMACDTGRFDNITYPDASGSYDSLAEQLINAPNGGAVAVLAASRASDGGIFRTFTKEIYRAAFEHNCIFTGELISTAKLLHIQHDGDPIYTRQFSLFGDPALVFASEVEPSGSPDLAVKPYQTTWSPEFNLAGDDISVNVGVANQSSVTATDVVVRLSGTSDGGTYEYEASVPEIGPWAVESVPFVIPAATLGNHEIELTVDPHETTAELDETNNSFAHSLYAYPGIAGYPIQLGREIHSPCVAHLGGEDARILIPDEDGSVWAIDASGAIDWVSPASWGASSYGPEIAAASGDLDGDGNNEVVATKFMGVIAFTEDGSELWTANTNDPVGCPVLADADSDGDLDAIISTRALFGGQSSLVAIDENGDEIWRRELSGDVDLTTTPVAGDFDLDGHIDIAYGTSEGQVAAISCASLPPSDIWGPLAVGSLQVESLGLADIDSDGRLELAIAGDGIWCLNAENGSSGGAHIPMDGPVSSLAVGDVDGDDVPDIVAATSAGTLTLVSSGACMWTRSLDGAPASSATIADVDGTEGSEILIGTDAGSLYVLSSDGSDLISPIPVGGECLTPFLKDLTGDQKLDVVVCTTDGAIFGLSFGGPAESSSAPDWLGLGGSAMRASILEQPFWGVVEGNLILSGNFEIVDDIVVPLGSTLTMASGTRLAFNESALEIGGTLFAPGTPGNEIVLCSGTEPRTRWGGIEATPGSCVTMQSCVVTDADTGLDAHNAAVMLTGCQFAYNGVGARIGNGSLYAINSSFCNSDGAGLAIEDGSGSVIDCALDANGTAALSASGVSDYQFIRSVFSGTLDGDGAVFNGYSSAQLDSCVFRNNSENGVTVKRSAPRFHACEFTDNSLYGAEFERLAHAEMDWSLATGNRIGVVTRTCSFPDLGSGGMGSEAGFNSIYGNQQAAVANFNTEPMPLYAKGNWWGGNPPAGRIFIGYIAYQPWLSEEPDPSMGPTGIDWFDLPREFGLAQNRPNPFNPTTTLFFAVPPPGGHVSISVHDVSGRLVRTLHEGAASPGSHDVTWDGRDALGNRVASGIYFARMDAPDFSAARKMLLIK